MKKFKRKRQRKKTLAFMLAVTLSVSPLSVAGQVEAQAAETETEEKESEERESIPENIPGNIQMEETSDSADAVTTGEEVTDKDYVVYIEMPGEKQDEAECTDSENPMNAEDSDNQNSISGNTVSDNTVSGNAPTENDEVDQPYMEDKSSTEAEASVEEIQEEIEEVKELLEKKSDAEEVVQDAEAVVYEADLTGSEIKELEESDATIYVEENIELFGAGGKSKNKKEKSQKEEKQKSANPVKDEQESDSKNDKKSKENTGEEQVTEPEWNIQMVNAVTDENSAVNEAGSEVTDGTALSANEATGEKIKIAVMDSGIELLAGIPVQQINNMVASEEYLPYYMNDMTGHGTAIAGIIYDIAPNAEIYSVRIMDSENKATLSRVVEGIYWCIENDMDIINMSFGTQTESKVLEKAIKDADKAGILMVSSAGNGNTEGVEYPAAYEEVIAVGAVNTMAQKTEESAVGEEVELVAPGEQIISDSMLGLETVVSGTSMAAPHVTGAAAVLWQKDTTKSADFIRGLLSQAANSIGEAEEYGNGLVDLAYALEQYEEYEAAYQEVEEERNDAEAATEQNQESTAVAEQEDADTIASGTELTEEMLIEENESPVETYEEVDYVEGRWSASENEEGHLSLVDKARSDLAGTYTFTKKEIDFFKMGAVFPDSAFKINGDEGDEQNKCFHGGCGVNYIANYLYATQVAKSAGTDYNKRVKGQNQDSFNYMSGMFNNKHKYYKKLFQKVYRCENGNDAGAKT